MLAITLQLLDNQHFVSSIRRDICVVNEYLNEWEGECIRHEPTELSEQIRLLRKVDLGYLYRLINKLFVSLALGSCNEPIWCSATVPSLSELTSRSCKQPLQAKCMLFPGIRSSLCFREASALWKACLFLKVSYPGFHDCVTNFDEVEESHMLWMRESLTIPVRRARIKVHLRQLLQSSGLQESGPSHEPSGKVRYRAVHPTDQ